MACPAARTWMSLSTLRASISTTTACSGVRASLGRSHARTMSYEKFSCARAAVGSAHPAHANMRRWAGWAHVRGRGGGEGSARNPVPLPLIEHALYMHLADGSAALRMLVRTSQQCVHASGLHAGNHLLLPTLRAPAAPYEALKALMRRWRPCGPSIGRPARIETWHVGTGMAAAISPSARVQRSCQGTQLPHALGVQPHTHM